MTVINNLNVIDNGPLRALFQEPPDGSLARSRAGIPIFRPRIKSGVVQTGDTPPARPALEKFLPAENAALRLMGKEVQPALLNLQQKRKLP